MFNVLNGPCQEWWLIDSISGNDTFVDIVVVNLERFYFAMWCLWRERKASAAFFKVVNHW